MRRHGIGKTSAIIDGCHRGQHFRRDLLVELDIAFKLTDGRANKHLALLVCQFDRIKQTRHTDKMGLFIGQLFQLGTLSTFNQHLDSTIRQFEQLQYISDGTHRIEILQSRFIRRSLFLGNQQDTFVLLHRSFKTMD